MAVYIVIVGLVLALSIYGYFCVKTGMLVNIYTPIFIVLIPSRYVLELIYLLLNGQEGSDYGYFVVFSLYTIELLGLVFGYLLITRSTTFKFIQTNRISPGWAWFLLLVAFLVYLPVLLEFREFITQPREIYTRTRTGYGLYFFGSLFFANLAFVAFLFAEIRRLSSRVIFFLALFFIVGTHGSKGAFVTLFFVFVLYMVYIKNVRQSLGKTFRYVTAFFIVMVLLFYVSLPESMKLNFFNGIVNYSDYTRHGVMVIDNPPKVQYGKLILEDNWISFIPRAIYPQKPKDFGSFFLAKYYFPEWFYGDTGSPAFGVGVYYADFREAAFVILFLISLLVGALAKLFLNRMRKFRSASDFIMLLFFAGVPLLNLGTGYLFFPHLVLTCLFVIFVKLFNLTARY